MSACPPSNPPPDAAAIAALIAANPCAALADMRVAYYRMISGGRKTHVSFNSRSVQYQNVSPDFLRREIAKLERMCPDPIRNPNPHAQASQARGRFPGGPAQPPGLGILPAGYFSRYR